MSKRKVVDYHTFYCMNCGKEIFQLPRARSHQYQKHHRKVLYCPWCKNNCNAIECRSYEEIENFKEAYAAGEYAEEAKESINFLKNYGMVMA